MNDLQINPTVAATAIAILNLIGGFLKASPLIETRFVPLILCASGPVIVCLFDGWSRGNALLGVGVALSAIGVHQTALKNFEKPAGEPPRPPFDPKP